MAYSKKDTIEQLQKALKTKDQLYNCKCINWSGTTSDSNEDYSEVISEELLNVGIDNLKSEIKTINRSNYKVSSHDKEISRNKTNRIEENFAKSLVWFDIKCLGEIIDFQVPLKQIRSDQAGKIDLISFKSDINPFAYIIELKYIDNKETLLRAALEIFTYHCQLNKEAFLVSFKEYNNLKPDDIKKAILLGEGSAGYKEAKTELDQKPKLKELIKQMGVEIFLFEYKVSNIKL